MRQDSAFSISNCNAPGCSNPYSHLSASSIHLPSILLRYRNIPSSTPQRSFPSAHCPNSSPYATCFEPWNAPQAIPYTPPYGTARLGPNEASFLYQSDGGRLSRTHLRRWIRAYQEGGIGALEHPQSKTMTEHRKNPFIADKPDQEKTQAELIEELCYMRAEVTYLKELKALSQKRTEKDKAKPSKH